MKVVLKLRADGAGMPIFAKFSGNYFEDTLTKFNDYSGELFPEVIIYE